MLEPLPTRLNGVGMRRESGSWAEWLDALARTMSGRLREPSDGEKMLARLARDRIGRLIASISTAAEILIAPV